MTTLTKETKASLVEKLTELEIKIGEVKISTPLPAYKQNSLEECKVLANEVRTTICALQIATTTKA